jgi:hypothetical protein
MKQAEKELELNTQKQTLVLDVSQWQTGTYFVNLKNYSSKLTIVK